MPDTAGVEKQPDKVKDYHQQDQTDFDSDALFRWLIGPHFSLFLVDRCIDRPKYTVIILYGTVNIF